MTKTNTHRITKSICLTNLINTYMTQTQYFCIYIDLIGSFTLPKNKFCWNTTCKTNDTNFTHPCYSECWFLVAFLFFCLFTWMISVSHILCDKIMKRLGKEIGGLFGGLVVSHLVGQQLILMQLYLLLVERNLASYSDNILNGISLVPGVF